MWAALLAAVSLIPAGCGSSREKSGESRTGAPATASTADSREVVGRIGRLLDRIARIYDPAAPDASGELAATAYLENYELIEDGVKDVAPDLNARLEPLLGAQLRKLIRTGAPKAEIETAVRRAKALLDRAVPALVTAE